MKSIAEVNCAQCSAEAEETTVEELRLQILFSRLFIDRKVEFFDAEPDEEFINVFDHVSVFPIEERRRALEEFRRELRLEESFAGEYGRMSEILIQSEDFVKNIGVPFLMFNLTYDEDKTDPTYLFRLDLFEVFYVGDECFLVVLYVRNVQQSHMEMYMRFTKGEASRVVRALLRIYEDYMGYSNQVPPSCAVVENELEEIFVNALGGLEATQFKEAREATEAKFKGLSTRN
jgi:hypothetical protein